MSISNVSSAAGQYQTLLQPPSNAETKAYQALASSLQTGNLAGAQQAYAALQQALPGGTAANSAPSTQSRSQSDSLTTAFQNLGAALQSGNLGQAQQAFQALQTDAQGTGKSGKGHHHHHGSGGAQSATGSTSILASATTPATAAAAASDSDSTSGSPGTADALLNVTA